MPSNIESRKTYTYANTCVDWARANRQVYTKSAACTSTKVGHMFWIHMLNLSLPILSKQYVSLDIWCFISSLCVCALNIPKTVQCHFWPVLPIIALVVDVVCSCSFVFIILLRGSSYWLKNKPWWNGWNIINRHSGACHTSYGISPSTSMSFSCAHQEALLK